MARAGVAPSRPGVPPREVAEDLIGQLAGGPEAVVQAAGKAPGLLARLWSRIAGRPPTTAEATRIAALEDKPLVTVVNKVPAPGSASPARAGGAKPIAAGIAAGAATGAIAPLVQQTILGPGTTSPATRSSSLEGAAPGILDDFGVRSGLAGAAAGAVRGGLPALNVIGITQRNAIRLAKEQTRQLRIQERMLARQQAIAETGATARQGMIMVQDVLATAAQSPLVAAAVLVPITSAALAWWVQPGILDAATRWARVGVSAPGAQSQVEVSAPPRPALVVAPPELTAPPTAPVTPQLVADLGPSSGPLVLQPGPTATGALDVPAIAREIATLRRSPGWSEGMLERQVVLALRRQVPGLTATQLADLARAIIRSGV